jgi:rare lipoprotein A (peptidoglycan hydrolase)
MRYESTQVRACDRGTFCLYRPIRLRFSRRRKAGPRAGIEDPGGEASWYGPGFHGRRTASGEQFDSNALTAAHRTLPFGSRVRVVNKRTGDSVVVRINDRGPYVGGRVIDLSRASAEALGISGVGSVEISVL